MANYDAYIHVTFTNDPDNYVTNDGSSIPIVITFRETEESDSDVLTAITGVYFLVTFCNRYGRTYDVYRVPVTTGVASFTFTATVNHLPEVVYINKDAVEPIHIGSDVYRARNKVVDFTSKRFIVYSTTYIP